MIWIVDGTRRKNDKGCFVSHVESSGIIDVSKEERILKSFGKCPLLQDWWESTVPVFFDLGEDRLWVLISKTARKYLFKANYYYHESNYTISCISKLSPSLVIIMSVIPLDRNSYHFCSILMN